jgi:hypothetical protein
MSAISRRITPGHCHVHEASHVRDPLFRGPSRAKLTSRLYLRRPRPASGVVQSRLPCRSHGMSLSNLAGISAKGFPLNHNMKKLDDKIYREETAFLYAR